MDLYAKFAAEREEVAYFMRRLYEKNLTTSSGGNISYRIDDTYVLLTPSALDKGRMQADEIILARLDGENLTPRLKMTMETGMHLAVYKARADVRAVVHAHPVFATAFACVEGGLDTTLTSEIYMHVPVIGYAGFAAPGSEDLARRVAASLADANVSLMQNHGAIAVAGSLYKAFDLLESIETAAKINVVAKATGGGSSLTDEMKKAIDAVCGR